MREGDAGQKAGPAGQQRNIERLAQPAGKPNMIRVVVGDNQPLDLLAGHWSIEKCLPSGFGFAVGDAGIDNEPSVMVLNEVDIHVVEPEG